MLLLGPVTFGSPLNVQILGIHFVITTTPYLGPLVGIIASGLSFHPWV